jgi:hypothetical protein
MPGRLSPEERPEVVEDSVNWLRNNELKPEISPSYGSDEPHGEHIMPEGHDSAKKKAIDDAMNWLRNNDPNPADVDDPTAGLANLWLPMPGRLSPGEAQWLRIQ